MRGCVSWVVVDIRACMYMKSLVCSGGSGRPREKGVCAADSSLSWYCVVSQCRQEFIPMLHALLQSGQYGCL